MTNIEAIVLFEDHCENFCGVYENCQKRIADGEEVECKYAVALSALREREERSKGCQRSTKTMTELKPCPFCGRNLLDLQYTDREDRGRSAYRWTAKIVCLNCFGSATTHGFEATEEVAKQKAVEAWNRRATNEAD